MENTIPFEVSLTVVAYGEPTRREDPLYTYGGAEYDQVQFTSHISRRYPKPNAFSVPDMQAAEAIVNLDNSYHYGGSTLDGYGVDGKNIGWLAKKINDLRLQKNVYRKGPINGYIVIYDSSNSHMACIECAQRIFFGLRSRAQLLGLMAPMDFGHLESVKADGTIPNYTPEDSRRMQAKISKCLKKVLDDLHSGAFPNSANSVILVVHPRILRIIRFYVESMFPHVQLMRKHDGTFESNFGMIVRYGWKKGAIVGSPPDAIFTNRAPYDRTAAIEKMKFAYSSIPEFLLTEPYLRKFFDVNLLSEFPPLQKVELHGPDTEWTAPAIVGTDTEPLSTLAESTEDVELAQLIMQMAEEPGPDEEPE